MFRQHVKIAKFIAICVCVLFILAGYRYLIDMSCPNPKTIHQALKNHPRSESQHYKDTILDMTRTMIKIDMWDYHFNESGVDKLEDLVTESGGTPIRSIIVSTWRSGSSFLGDFINSAPASFYSYEPLKMFGVYNQIRGPPHAERATGVLKNILKCDFNNGTDLVEYFKYAKKNVKIANQFKHNRKFWNKCNYKRELCFDANFTATFCKLFPFQAMKLDRFRLPLVENILEGEELNVKVVLLVRDPRGVMQSRRHIKNFCSAKKVPDCEDAGSVCSDMITDHNAAATFLKRYPGRLMVLRYEDLALNLEVTTVQLLKFLRIERTQSIQEFLKTHTNVWNSQRYSTFRVTKNIPFKWKKAMKFNAVRQVQEKCREAMSLWGYAFAHNASHLASKKFNPLIPYHIKQNNQSASNS